MLIVAMKLTPDEFGMAALTLAIGKFMVVLPPATMGDLLVAHAQRWHEFAPAGRRLVFRVALAITIALIVLAPIFALIYDQYPFGVLVGLIMVVAVRPTAEACVTIPLSQLRLSLRYRAIALIDGTSQFAGTALTVVLALCGASALALVIPQIVVILVRAVCYRSAARTVDEWTLVPPTDSAVASAPTLWREFASIGGAQFIHSVIDTLPVLVLGRFASETQTGLYAFAAQFAAQANAVISFQLGVVLQPIFGRLKDDPVRQTSAFLRSVAAVSAIAVPLTLVQAAVAQPLFALMFDPSWEPAWPIFVALSVVEAFYFATAPTIALLKAQGRFRTFLAWQSIQLAVSIVAYPIAASVWGAIGVALTAVSIWGFSLPIAVWLGTRSVGGTWWSALRVFVAPWWTALPIALMVYGSWLLLAPWGVPGMVVVLAVIGPTGFVLAVLATRIGQPATYAELAPMFARAAGKCTATIRRFVIR